MSIFCFSNCARNCWLKSSSTLSSSQLSSHTLSSSSSSSLVPAQSEIGEWSWKIATRISFRNYSLTFCGKLFKLVVLLEETQVNLCLVFISHYVGVSRINGRIQERMTFCFCDCGEVNISLTCPSTRNLTSLYRMNRLPKPKQLTPVTGVPCLRFVFKNAVLHWASQPSGCLQQWQWRWRGHWDKQSDQAEYQRGGIENS